MSSTIRGSDNFNSTLSSTLGTSTTNTMHQKAISDAIKFGVAPTHTADATFTAIDNKIVMPGIVTALQLEVGDVIQFSNAIAQNNKPRTVESITDNNTIIVNYEHAGNRGNGSLRLADQSATVAIKRISKWYNAPLGLGQSGVNVRILRVAGTTYTNTTGRTIQAQVSSHTWDSGVFVTPTVDGIAHRASGASGSISSAGAAVTLDITRDSEYSFAGIADGASTVWVEVR